MTIHRRQFRSLLKSLKQFNIYLQSNDCHSFRKLKKYLRLCDRSVINRDLNLINIGSSPEIKRLIEQLFTILEIDKTQWLLHFDPKLTVYQFLKEMAEKNNSEKLQDIIRLIDVKLSISKFQVLLMMLLVTGVSLIAIFVPLVQALLLNLTIVGFIYTSTVALYKLRQNYYCELNKSDFAKIRDTFFLLSNILLNLTAYGLWIASATFMTPLVAGLFIASSVSDVVKEIFLGIENHIRYLHEKKLLLSTGTSYAQSIRIARLDYEYREHRNAALINLAGALVLSGLIATWCLLPASIFITIGLVAAIIVAQATTYFFNKCNHSYNKSGLNTKLSEIHQDNDLLEKKKSRLRRAPTFPTLAEQPIEYKPSPLFSPRKASSKFIPKFELSSNPNEKKDKSTGYQFFTPQKSNPRTRSQSVPNVAPIHHPVKSSQLSNKALQRRSSLFTPSKAWPRTVLKFDLTAAEKTNESKKVL